MHSSWAVTLLYMILSSSLLIMDNKEIGLQLRGSSLLDPLGIGTIFDTFQADGSLPV